MSRTFIAPLLASLVPLFSAGSPTASFTRATTATVMAYDPTDNLRLITVASGEARFMGARRISQGVWSRFFSSGLAINTSNGGDASVCDAVGPFGYLTEDTRINRCLQSEDFSNAAWVKTTTTVTPNTTTAPDGTLTADTLTATGANSTVIQDLGVVANAAKFGSVWLQRITGSGLIQLTMDGGAGWTTVAVTTTMTRFSLPQTLADEDFGIRIVTNGDAVAAWGADVKTGAELTTYVATTAGAATANADVLNYAFAGNGSAVAGSVYGEVRAGSPPIGSSSLVTFSAAGFAAPSLLLLQASANTALIAGGFATTTPTALAAGTWGSAVHRAAATYTVATTSAQAFADGTASASLGTLDFTGVGTTVVNLGSIDPTGVQHLNGTLRNVRIWDNVMFPAAGAGTTQVAQIFMGGAPKRVARSDLVASGAGTLMGFIDNLGASTVILYDAYNGTGTPFAMVDGPALGKFLQVPAAYGQALFADVIGDVTFFVG